jgi:hypothetical protein
LIFPIPPTWQRKVLQGSVRIWKAFSRERNREKKLNKRYNKKTALKGIYPSKAVK